MKATEESKELLQGRVKEDIEKHRKGFCKLKVNDSSGKPLKGKRVKIKQKTHDFGFGANIFMLDEFDSSEYNRIYRDEFKKYFNLATVPFYWKDLEPKKGELRFSKSSSKIYRRPAPELCMEYCEENGITPKLHCLVYENFIPDWLPKNDINAMEAYYSERFRQISERFSERMTELEVINEVLCAHYWSGKSVISSKRDVVEWAFKLARKYFPNERLVINEAQPLSELAQARYRSRYFMLIENALRGGAEIDKIGFQHHIFTGVNAKNEAEYEQAVKNVELVDPRTILAGMDALAEFGLPLEATEVTVPTFGDSLEDEELQADLLEMLYSVWFSHPNMESIVYWNVPDGYAYNNGSGEWNENQCRGGLLHHDLTPKRSAERLYRLINETWHTEAELVTDENGYIELRGFYGNYVAKCEGNAANFGIHKGKSNVSEILL